METRFLARVVYAASLQELEGADCNMVEFEGEEEDAEMRAALVGFKMFECEGMRRDGDDAVE